MIRKQYDHLLGGASGGGTPQPHTTQQTRFMRATPIPTTWIGKLWRRFYDNIAAYPTPRYVEITDPQEIALLLQQSQHP